MIEALGLNILAALFYDVAKGLGKKVFNAMHLGTGFKRHVDSVTREIAMSEGIKQEVVESVLAKTIWDDQNVKEKFGRYVDPGEMESAVSDYLDANKVAEVPAETAQRIITLFDAKLGGKIVSEPDPQERMILDDLSMTLHNLDEKREEAAAGGLLKLALVSLAERAGWNQMSTLEKKDFERKLCLKAELDPYVSRTKLVSEMIECNMSGADEVYRGAVRRDPPIRRLVEQAIADANVGTILEETSQSASGSEQALHSALENALSVSGGANSGIITALSTSSRAPKRIVLGKFEIDPWPIGIGGFGVVHGGRSIFEPRVKVAIKELRRELLRDASVIRSFRREAVIAMNIRHPNIVRVYEVGEEEGALVIVMEFMEGGSLETMLQSQRPSLSAALRIICEICDGLIELKRHEVVHRDLKPANILFTRRREAKISDFGLAKAIESYSAAMGAYRAGTPQYMAPEQLRPPYHTDARTDIYALGAIAYEMLTGRFYMGDLHSPDLQEKILAVRPEAPSELNKTIPYELSSSILKCLEKSPNNRYEHAVDLKHAILPYAKNSV